MRSFWFRNRSPRLRQSPDPPTLDSHSPASSVPLKHLTSHAVNPPPDLSEPCQRLSFRLAYEGWTSAASLTDDHDSESSGIPVDCKSSPRRSSVKRPISLGTGGVAALRRAKQQSSTPADLLASEPGVTPLSPPIIRCPPTHSHCPEHIPRPRTLSASSLVKAHRAAAKLRRKKSFERQRMLRGDSGFGQISHMSSLSSTTLASVSEASVQMSPRECVDSHGGIAEQEGGAVSWRVVLEELFVAPPRDEVEEGVVEPDGLLAEKQGKPVDLELLSAHAATAQA
ncbi:MAG: hypothetical protein SGPRY_014413, partial [Prymnesium sp.]